MKKLKPSVIPVELEPLEDGLFAPEEGEILLYCSHNSQTKRIEVYDAEVTYAGNLLTLKIVRPYSDSYSFAPEDLINCYESGLDSCSRSYRIYPGETSSKEIS